MAEMEDVSHIGARIRTARVDKGWTQAHLSFKTSVPIFQISHIENGRIQGRDHLVNRLCKELKVNMKDSG